MSRNIWRKPEHAKAFVEDARRRGLVAEELRYAVPQDRHPPYGPGEQTAEPKTFTGKRRKMPNKTEAAYGRILEAKLNRGEIVRYSFESLAFRWGGTDDDTPMLYSPDWIVTLPGTVVPGNRILCVEVKGGHLWDRDLVRFKGCRAAWPEFQWEMWQYKGGEWRQIQ